MPAGSPPTLSWIRGFLKKPHSIAHFTKIDGRTSVRASPFRSHSELKLSHIIIICSSAERVDAVEAEAAILRAAVAVVDAPRAEDAAPRAEDAADVVADETMYVAHARLAVKLRLPVGSRGPYCFPIASRPSV
jgi:hypothetical protein